MQRQKKAGHRVSYFCAGRKYPFIKRSWIKTWDMDGIRIFEIINSKISHRGDEGTLFPDITISEPVSERFFRDVLNKVNPDIVHIHELAGLPSSLIDILVNEYSIPCLITLADYFLICPTLKLFNYVTHSHCKEMDVGEACQKCCEAAPKILRNDEVKTIRLMFNKIETHLGPNQLKRWKIIRKGLNNIYWKIKYLFDLLNKINKSSSNSPHVDSGSLADIYKKRRDINIARLKKISQIIARSGKVKEIYTRYIGSDTLISVINPYLSHIDNISMKKIEGKIKVINFATLNGFVSKQKGGDLLAHAIINLNKEGYQDRYRVYSFGGMATIYKDMLKYQPNIFYMGTYEANDLDRLLQDIHVGIIPSIWEEVFGYVGLELMAKGLPIIANSKGGITDYVIDRVNGLLNIEGSETGFIKLMKQLIDNPGMIVSLNKNIRNDWNHNYERHYQEMMAYYYSLLNDTLKKHI